MSTVITELNKLGMTVGNEGNGWNGNDFHGWHGNGKYFGWNEHENNKVRLDGDVYNNGGEGDDSSTNHDGGGRVNNGGVINNGDGNTGEIAHDEPWYHHGHTPEEYFDVPMVYKEATGSSDDDAQLREIVTSPGFNKWLNGPGGEKVRELLGKIRASIDNQEPIGHYVKQLREIISEIVSDDGFNIWKDGGDGANTDSSEYKHKSDGHKEAQTGSSEYKDSSSHVSSSLEDKSRTGSSYYISHGGSDSSSVYDEDKGESSEYGNEGNFY